METKDLTQEAIKKVEPQSGYELAKRMSVKPDTVYSWRDGKSVPNGRHLLKLLEIVQGRTAALLLATFMFSSLISQDAGASTLLIQKGNTAERLCIMSN